MEAMAHRNRWFNMLYLLKMEGFSMAMLVITRWYHHFQLLRDGYENEEIPSGY
jgi:hypothetical protein